MAVTQEDIDAAREKWHRQTTAKKAERGEWLLDTLVAAMVQRSHGRPRDHHPRQDAMAAFWDAFEASVGDILDDHNVVKKMEMD